MAAPHFDIDRAKALARTRALLVRAGCEPAWGHLLGEYVLREAPPPAGATVAGFWPLSGEVDIRPLLAELAARGHPIVLPVTPPLGHRLGFRLWRPGDALVAGRFGTLVPTGAEAQPDVVLVPLLAFDRRGYRLGYGGGYYDRTLAALPGAATLGCAFAAQEVDVVPAGPYDMRLDAVATETGVIACGDTA